MSVLQKASALISSQNSVGTYTSYCFIEPSAEGLRHGGQVPGCDVLASVRRRKACLFMVFISVTGSDKRHLLRLAALVLDLKACAFSVRSASSEAFVTIPRFALSSVSFKNDVCFSILSPFFFWWRPCPISSLFTRNRRISDSTHPSLGGHLGGKAS